VANKVSFTFVLVDKFSGTAKLLSSRLAGVRNALGSIGTAAKATTGAVVGGFRAMTGAAAGLMTALGPFLGVFAGIGAVFKFFSLGTSFQDAMADLSAVTGATGADLAFMREEALRLSKTTNIGAPQIAEAFKLVGSARSELLKDPRALTKLTEDVLLLANASGLDLATATDTVVTSMNQFGLASDQARRVVEALATGEKVGSATVKDVADAIVNAGSAANLAKVSFEETNAAIQVLARGGLTAERAGQQLNRVLLNLETSSTQGFRPSVVGLDKALENVQRTMGGNALAMEKLFGEGIKGAGILVSNVGLYRDWTKEIKNNRFAQDQAAVRLGTLSAKTRGLGITISNFVLRTFDRLAPQFDTAITQIGKWLDAITAQDVERFATRVANIATDIAFIVAAGAGATSKLFDFFGIGNDVPLAVGAGGANVAGLGSFSGAGAKSQTEINVNLRDPKGVVESVKSKTSGETSGLKVGHAMAEAL
jgi:hypothetical protein